METRQRTPLKKPHRTVRDAGLILFIVSALSMVYLLIFGENGYMELRKRERDLQQLEIRRNAQLETNKKLEEEIFLLRTSRDRIEREAREQFKLVRNEDIILKTSPDESLSASSTSKEATGTSPSPPIPAKQSTRSIQRSKGILYEKK